MGPLVWLGIGAVALYLQSRGLAVPGSGAPAAGAGGSVGGGTPGASGGGAQNPTTVPGGNGVLSGDIGVAPPVGKVLCGYTNSYPPSPIYCDAANALPGTGPAGQSGLSGVTPGGLGYTALPGIFQPGPAATGLNSTHRYEVYNGDKATYTAVPASTVRTLLNQNRRIYDRTAKVWLTK